MNQTMDRTDSALMGNVERGESIQARLDRLGISDRVFYERTGIDRKTLRRAVSGEARVRASTYVAIEAALDSFEAHVRGESAAQSAPHVISFRLTNAQGLDIVIEGPAEDADLLRAQVEALARALRN